MFSSYSSTPRRRLSLTDIQNTPTPIKSLSKADSTESGKFLFIVMANWILGSLGWIKIPFY